MRRYLGEALALKALGYFELIRYWGDVPYKEHASESGLGNVYIGKVDRDIVYNYIIEDLKEAIEYLPWMGEESYTVERMNKGLPKDCWQSSAICRRMVCTGWKSVSGLGCGTSSDHSGNERIFRRSP